MNKIEEQEKYKVRQRLNSKILLERQRAREKRVERNLMHRSVLLVGEDLKQRSLTDAQNKVLENSPHVILGNGTKVIE